MMANEPKSTVAAVREPEGETDYRREEKQTEVRQQSAVWEVPLREVTSLESEYNALSLRLGRLHPDMERYGEPLC